MQKKSWIYGGAAVLGLSALLLWAFAPRPLQVEVVAVTEGRFEASIIDDARTRLRERYSVSAPLAGRLERIDLREGDRVQAGQVVARLLPALPALLDARTLVAQQARIGMAEASLQRAGTRIERARIATTQAQSDLARSEQLAAQGFLAPTRIESERLAVQAAQEDARAAVLEQQVAHHDLAQARAALLTLRGGDGARGGFEVRSPVAGAVLRVAQVSEGNVALGTALLELGDMAQLEVVAQLLTTEALQVKSGDPVRIERWGGPGELQGRVRRVEPGAFTKVSALGVEEQRVNVLIDLTSDPLQWQALGDGYRVSVRIVTRVQDKAALLPLSAVFPLPVVDAAATAQALQAPAPARMAVFTVKSGRARLVAVEVEARNAGQVWLRKGLEPGAQAIVYPPALLTDGARVQVRRP